MNKFKGYLICTDCDGTLTYEPGKVSEENAKAIRHFQNEGGKFTLATGRFPGHAHEFREQLEVNAPIVALNGTVLYDLKNEKLLREWTGKKEDYITLFEYIRKNYPKIWECWINYTDRDSVSLKPGEIQDDENAVRNLFEKLPENLYKGLSFQSSDITPILQKDLKEQFGHLFRFDTSWPEGLEIQPVDSGKGIAVQYMKEHFYQDIHTTIGVGDNENDLNLLQHVDIGYAVANALDSVKAVADCVTVANTEHALAKIIEELENEIDKKGEV